MRRCFLNITVALLALAPLAAHASLYDDLGGAAGVRVIVDGAVDRWLADPRVAPAFAESNIGRLRRLLNEQVCMIAGGPCQYTGRSMAQSHRGLELNEMKFNAVTEDLQDAMTQAGVGYHTQLRLIAKLAPMERDVVTK